MLHRSMESFIQGRGAAICLVSFVALFGCEAEPTDEGTPSGGSGAMSGAAGAAGAGGTSATGLGGTGGTGGLAGDDCVDAGSGSVAVRISGLPEGVAGNLILTGPEGSQFIDSETTLGALPAGAYLVDATRVADSDPLVRTVYDYSLETTGFCLADAGTQLIELSYQPVPTSNKLWTDNANGTGNLLGFGATNIEATASATPSVSVEAGAGKDVTFDADGNLWSMGATLADPHVMRFASASLGVSGVKQADRRIDLAGIPCLPALRAFAFDPVGALWVSTCGGVVSKLSPAQLGASGEVTPGVAITELFENGDLAFDQLANLWVISDGKLARFDAERLDASSALPPDLMITVRNAGDTADLAASNLAFDAAGNLWLIDFGGNLLAQVEETDLVGSGAKTVIAEVTIALVVSALLERPAFDESGGLWLALDQSRFGRLAPTQLLSSSTPGEPTTPATIITSAQIGNANRMAFYPAAAELPLSHRFR